MLCSMGRPLVLVIALLAASISEHQTYGKRVGRRVKKAVVSTNSEPEVTNPLSSPAAPLETPEPTPKPQIPVPTKDTAGKRGKDIPEIDEKEMKGVESRGGTRWALANILVHGQGGKVLPLGARDHTFGANFTHIATEFARSVNHGPEWVAHLEDWLHAGAGSPCDACKTMMEKMQGKALVIMNRAISGNAAQAKDYVGYKGHEVNITEPMKEEIRAVCESAAFDDHTRYIVKFCRAVMSEERSKFIIATLTDGTFGDTDMVRRKNAVCRQMLKVCPLDQDNEKLVTPCQGCAESFFDLEYLLRRDRPDLAMTDTGVKKRWNAPQQPVTFRSRRHVSFRLNDLCESTKDRHLTTRGEQIQEVCEEIREEYENEIVRAFAGEAVVGYGGAPWKICVDVAQKCEAEEFPNLRPHSYHLKPYPSTRETKATVPGTQSFSGGPGHTEL